MKKLILTLILFSATLLGVNAQSSVKDSIIKCVLVSPSFSLQLPGGDMADRFGTNSTVGVSVAIKNKKNWTFSLEGNFIFGSQIKETSIFSNLTVDGGCQSTTYYIAHHWQGGHPRGWRQRKTH